MRNDLDKLLCERERPRSWDHYSNYRHLERFNTLHDVPYDAEDLDEPYAGVGSGTRESMKYRYGYDSKTFGENLNPLYGVIRKNVGRRWDRVHSELCKVFDPRSVTGKHILEHVYDQLAKPENTYINEDGKVCVRDAYSVDSLVRNSRFSYYVDPRDGVLKANTHRKTYKQIQRINDARKVAEVAKVCRVIDSGTELHLIKGVWFEVKFATHEGTKKTTMVKRAWSDDTYAKTVTEYPCKYDVLLKQEVSSARVAVSKRTANHKELKRIGLAF